MNNNFRPCYFPAALPNLNLFCYIKPHSEKKTIFAQPGEIPTLEKFHSRSGTLTKQNRYLSSHTLISLIKK